MSQNILTLHTRSHVSHTTRSCPPTTMAKGSRPGKRSRPNISGIARFANVFDGQPNGDNHGVNGQPVFVGADEEENLEAGPSTPMKSTSPPSSSSKKQRIGVLPSIHAKYDALHLVTRYESVSDVPEHLQKCEYKLSLFAHTSD